MKKTYLQPKMAVHSMCTATTIMAVSGNLKVGDTTTVSIGEGEIDGGDAWTKGNDWDRIWD